MMVSIQGSVARLVAVLLASPACLLTLRGELACPAIFSDHMVLQRDRAVAVWGTAAANEAIRVTFAGQSVETSASTDGHWLVRLPPMPACNEPQSLHVEGTNVLRFDDVLVGEVWLCSGQSNMEKQLGPRRGQKPTDNWKAEVAAADHPRLRLFQMPQHGGANGNVLGLRWVPCTPETIVATEFSAAGYFFGREVQQVLDVPIGLIHSSFGGTMIEAWISEDGFAKEPAIASLRSRTYQAWVDGVQPTELNASMIAPLAPYTLRGFLWYQGEANCMDGDGEIYAAKMCALIRDWRNTWQDEGAPFYFVQLAPFDYSRWKTFTKLLTPEALPLFWETQARVLDIPNTGMVVTTDLAGSAKDIHPTNKHDVGVRLARLALAHTYERTDVPAHFTHLERSTLRADGSIELTFRNTGGFLGSRDGNPLTHFQIAGSDRAFHSATAEIHGEKIVVRAVEVPAPVSVRFGWTETANPNLINASGLPVMPFRTDAWPVVVERPRPEPPAEAPKS